MMTLFEYVIYLYNCKELGKENFGSSLTECLELGMCIDSLGVTLACTL